MRHKLVIMVTVAAVGMGLAACVPTFAAGATLTATPLGPLVTLTWSAADEPDDGQEVATYRIDVDGVKVAQVPAAQTTCVLTGLAPATSYDLEVTAYDTNAEWSGNNATSGAVSASYTTPDTGDAGSTRTCVAPTDTDGDRLPNALENGSGTYVSAASPGTSPTNADTDADGLRDGDETLGTTGGVDLPALGTRGVKKNLLFEFDWFDDNADSGTCAAHSHRPTTAIIGRAATAFADAPVLNPDGSTGITMISDYGQGDAFTGGNLVPDADGVIAGGVSDSTYTSIKATHFSAARQDLFHYVLLPHRYGTTSSSSGQAEINGNDMIVSLQCSGSTTNVANTIVHEVGHNLGLRHGGNVNTNHKPNYNSVMNYRYQFPGIDTNCTVAGNGVLSFSVGTRAPLNENALIETNGICNGVDVDWNANSTIDAVAVSVEINQDSTKTTLFDYNDWANISLGAVTIGSSPPAAQPEVITEQPVPGHARGN